MLINIRLSDGILEIVEPGFDARVWRSNPVLMQGFGDRHQMKKLLSSS